MRIPCGHDTLFLVEYRAPELLGHKRHEGMQQEQHLLKHMEKRIDDTPLAFSVFAVEVGFHQFKIPVAELMPDKLINTVCRFIESICGKMAIDVVRAFRKPAQNPAVACIDNKINVAGFAADRKDAY